MPGASIACGIAPGPRIFVERPEVFWAVIIFIQAVCEEFLLYSNSTAVAFFYIHLVDNRRSIHSGGSLFCWEPWGAILGDRYEGRVAGPQTDRDGNRWY